MWSSFLDQIQQRIDDAAEFLGDEEAEDAQEAERGAVVGGSVSPPIVLASSATPPVSSTSNAAPSSTAVAAHAGASGWEDDEVDVVAPSAAPAAVFAAETPTTENEPVRSPAPPACAPEPQEAEKATVLSTDAAVRTPEEDAKPAQPAASVHLSGSPPVAAAPALEADHVRDIESPQPSSAAVEETVVDEAPPSEPALANAEPPLLADPLPAKSPDASVAAPAQLVSAVTPATKETSGSQASLSDSAAQTPPATSLAEAPRLPTPSAAEACAAATRHASDVSQLLRFQQQLADEMENAASLQRQNSTLQNSVRLLEEELAGARARLANCAGSEEQISMLIEKLGKEKERHKAAASERAALEEHVQDLEDELEEYRVKEQSWIGGSEQQKQNESAAQQRIAQLEKDLRSRDVLLEDLNTRLHDATHQSGVFQRQVEELKASYSAQLSTVKETSSDTADQLRREVEQLRASLQSLSTEYDTRTTELERELQQANARAHQAEARFSDVELGSVNTLQDIRNELEDSQRSIATWKAEAHKTRSDYAELLSQYALLKRTRAAAEADLRDRVAQEAATSAGLRKELRESEERYQALQETLRGAQAEAEEQRRTIMLLEASAQKLKTAGAETLNQSQSESSLGSPALTKGVSLDASFSTSQSNTRQSTRALPAGVPMYPFANRERPAWSDSTDRKTRERLEQEVLRQSTELERLRLLSLEGVEWKTKFAQLQTEHDLLLQLYGQLEEDMRAAKSSATAPTATTAAGVAATAAPPLE